MRTIIKLGTAVLLTTAPLAQGAVKIWEPNQDEEAGAINSNWGNFANWSPQGIPAPEDYVNISTGTGSPVYVNGSRSCEALTLAPGGQVGNLALDSGSTLIIGMGVNNRSFVVGGAGAGGVAQSGGFVSTKRFTVIGDQSGASGVFNMTGGVLYNEFGVVVGDEGHGELTLYNGVWTNHYSHAIVGNHGTGVLTFNGGAMFTYGAIPIEDNEYYTCPWGGFTLGNREGSHGVLHFNGGVFNPFVADADNGISDLCVGNEGCGEMYVNGGLVNVRSRVVVGYANTNSPLSKLHILGGTFAPNGRGGDYAVTVGEYGKGELLLETNVTAEKLHVGTQPGGYGRVEIRENCTLHLQCAPYPYPPPAVLIGIQGHGELNLRGGTLSNVRGAILRDHADGAGIIRGWGVFHNNGYKFTNNGQIIADGEGQDRDLSFPGYDTTVAIRHIANTLPNDGVNGYYAQNGGRLLLPGIFITGPGDYLWGEDESATGLAMVNAVRIKVAAATGVRPHFNVDILAADRADLPLALPRSGPALGIWKVYFPNAENGTKIEELEIRYDHAAARGCVPDLFQYNPGMAGWTKLESVHDPVNHTLTVSAPGGLDVFQAHGQDLQLGHIVAVRPIVNVFLVK